MNPFTISALTAFVVLGVLFANIAVIALYVALFCNGELAYKPRKNTMNDITATEIRINSIVA
jgi:hypothetical protein